MGSALRKYCSLGAASTKLGASLMGSPPGDPGRSGNELRFCRSGLLREADEKYVLSNPSAWRPPPRPHHC